MDDPVEDRTREMINSLGLSLNKMHSISDIKSSELKQQDIGSVKSILGQRYKQRERLFCLSMRIVKYPMLSLALILGLQCYRRFEGDATFSFFDGHQLEIMMTAIFGEAFGLILVIAKSIWNDEPYKEIFLKEAENGNDKKE